MGQILAERPREESSQQGRVSAERPRKSTKQQGSEFWARMDELRYRTLKKAESAYTINMLINVITVAIGVALFTTSIVLSWIQQANPSTVAFAVVGVADFVALFLVGPQRGIESSLANLNQIQMAYETFLFEFEALIDYNWEKYTQGNRSIEEITSMNRESEKVMTTAMDAIAKYIGKVSESK